MPTYEYRCNECGHEFEAFQRMTDEPLSKCPECEGAVKRLIGTGAGIIFKGSGFYETDYKRGDGYKQAADKEKSSSSSTAESSTGSSSASSTSESSSSKSDD